MGGKGERVKGDFGGIQLGEAEPGDQGAGKGAINHQQWRIPLQLSAEPP